MTGMCGGRGDGEDGGAAAVEAGGGRGHGDVLAGAGRSGGGEERLGALAVGVAETPFGLSALSSCSVSMPTGSGASAEATWRLVNTVVRTMGGCVDVETFSVGLDLTGWGVLRTSEGAELAFCGGLCCSTDAQDGEEAEENEEAGEAGRPICSWGDAGGAVCFSFSIMVKSTE